MFRHFGRLRDFLAPVSAWCARYARRPPCLAISRDTTDGFRPIVAAMSFCCICAARQREISSLSANVSISRRTLPPIHSRVRQSLSLRGNPSHGDPIRPVRENRPLHPIAKTGCDQGLEALTLIQAVAISRRRDTLWHDTPWRAAGSDLSHRVSRLHVQHSAIPLLHDTQLHQRQPGLLRDRK